jgi:hypothetical protein
MENYYITVDGIVKPIRNEKILNFSLGKQSESVKEIHISESCNCISLTAFYNNLEVVNIHSSLIKYIDISSNPLKYVHINAPNLLMLGNFKEKDYPLIEYLNINCPKLHQVFKQIN